MQGPDLQPISMAKIHRQQPRMGSSSAIQKDFQQWRSPSLLRLKVRLLFLGEGAGSSSGLAWVLAVPRLRGVALSVSSLPFLAVHRHKPVALSCDILDNVGACGRR
jgi:hypothetical protein